MEVIEGSHAYIKYAYIKYKVLYKNKTKTYNNQWGLYALVYLLISV